MPIYRDHRTPLFKFTKLIGIIAVAAAQLGVAQAADPPASTATVDAPPGTTGATPTPVPPTLPDVSAPGTVPRKWEPGIAVEQLPAGAYPEASDGGIFGTSLTLGPPTRGIWGGSLWLTFHGLQWPYMPKTGVGISGYAWVDSGYVQIKRPPDRANRQFWLQDARAVLRVTPTYSNGSFFAQAQVEIVGIKDQFAPSSDRAQTDDLWLRVGHWNRWDLQVGRFESWEVFHLGMGLDVNTLERKGATHDADPLPVYPYLVRFPFETRPSGPGYGALHLYPFSFLRFELLGIAGADATTLNSLGTRPALVADFGMIKLKLAGEYIKYRGRDDDPTTLGPSLRTKYERGVGGGIIFILDPRIEAGVNLSLGSVDEADMRGPNGAATFDILSAGGFANARITGDWIVGAGATFTRKADYNFAGSTKAGYLDHLQGFGALQYVLAKKLFIKAVFGYARATFSPAGIFTDTHNYMYSGRIRLMYLF